jgi:hypothetical protein
LNLKLKLFRNTKKLYFVKFRYLSDSIKEAVNKIGIPIKGYELRRIESM